jgi:hypothetical protein
MNPLLWKAHITTVEGTVLEIVSALRIQLRRVVDTHVLLFVGEHDTVGIPEKELSSFRIFQVGVTIA